MQVQLPKRDADTPLAVGFLTAVNAEDDGGVLGGYLVLNAAARPLEFHCTAPVRANRAQQILYGPTLKPYLYGEQIGQALLSKSRLKVELVVTDVEAMLSAQAPQSAPLVCVLPGGASANDGAGADDGGRLRCTQLSLGPLPAVLPRDVEPSEVRRRWAQFGDDFDLLEPFGRIHEAIAEAQKTHKAA